MFKMLNDIGWTFSIIIIVGSIIFYFYEKINGKDKE